MSSADPPLLATDQHSETPNLGPAQADLEPSPLERLIQQSTTEQQLLQQQQEVEDSSSAPQFFLEEGPTSFSIAPPVPISLPQTSASMFLTLGAAFLCLLHTGLVWASFLSEAWFTTHLRFTVDWLDGTKDTLLHTSTLSSLLSEFLDADLNGAAVALLLTSLVLPCISMILTSGWTISDHKERAITNNNNTTVQPFRKSRPVIEWMLRLSLATVFSLSILDVATVSIDLVGNGSDLRIVNRTGNGLVCYSLGIVLALVVIGILRWAKTKTCVLPTTTTDNNSSRVEAAAAESPSSLHAPPSHAFQLPWTRSMDSQNNLADQTEPLLPISESDTPQTMIRHAPNAFARLPAWKKIVLYEMALGATFLLIPALFLPLFTLEFGGLSSQFIEEKSITFYFWEFPKLLHNGGYLAETKHWIILTQGAILLLLVYIVPLLAASLAIGTWRSGPTASKQCYRILYIVQPMLCSLVFAGSVWVAVPAFQPLAAWISSNKTSGICDKFHLITDDDCLTMTGEPRMGVWFLIAQSISLEALVIFTLIWRSS